MFGEKTGAAVSINVRSWIRPRSVVDEQFVCRDSNANDWSASQPRVVYEGRFLRSINGNTSWSINKEATRFLRIQLVAPERAITHVDLVLNWFSELKQKVAAK